MSLITASDDFDWEDLDQRLLSAKISDLADEMHKRIAEGERKVEFDTRQSGNAAGYLTRLFDFHERLTDEWAERLYAAHREAWIQQNRTVSAGFIRAVRDRAIAQLIAARKSSVQAVVCLRGTRIGEQPNLTALGEWNRRMDRLAARWGRKLEADAGASVYRASTEILAPSTPEPEEQTVAKNQTGKSIFIGHGGSQLWKEVKDFLSERLHLAWDEFNREPAAGLATKERLETMLDNASFAFLVMTAEDERPDGAMHARENVVHEAGLFQGRLGFKRAIILLEEGCAEFSNIEGLTQIRFPKGNIAAKFEEIRRVLEREGILR